MADFTYVIHQKHHEDFLGAGIDLLKAGTAAIGPEPKIDWIDRGREQSDKVMPMRFFTEPRIRVGSAQVLYGKPVILSEYGTTKTVMRVRGIADKRRPNTRRPLYKKRKKVIHLIIDLGRSFVMHPDDFKKLKSDIERSSAYTGILDVSV